MRIVAYTKAEGGRWYRWRKHKEVTTYHALLFSNGKVWDTLNGFRKLRYTRERVRHIRYAKV